MFFSLLFWRLSKYARRYGENGRLKTKVNILLEEFSNIGHLSDFLRIISVIRSRNIACQLIIQSAAQLSDRYPGSQWEEIISNIDWQLFLGCNDLMTAEYISKKCGMVTIRTQSSQAPQTPLFSPINSSTRPYSQTSSSTQRPLMFPDELLRMDRDKSILLVGGQNPLELYKITPEEIPGFDKLQPVRVTDHIPSWREIEAERERRRQNEDNAQQFSHTATDENVQAAQPRVEVPPAQESPSQPRAETPRPPPQETAPTSTPSVRPDTARHRGKKKTGMAEEVASEYRVKKPNMVSELLKVVVDQNNPGRDDEAAATESNENNGR